MNEITKILYYITTFIKIKITLKILINYFMVKILKFVY